MRSGVSKNYAGFLAVFPRCHLCSNHIKSVNELNFLQSLKMVGKTALRHKKINGAIIGPPAWEANVLSLNFKVLRLLQVNKCLKDFKTVMGCCVKTVSTRRL